MTRTVASKARKTAIHGADASELPARPAMPTIAPPASPLDNEAIKALFNAGAALERSALNMVSADVKSVGQRAEELEAAILAWRRVSSEVVFPR